MKTILPLVFTLAMCLQLHAQSRSFKTFNNEGDKLFEEGLYQEALDQYQQALREEPKAQRYKFEGTFLKNYLPRYSIALCYEKLDVSAAEEWVQKSKEALEINVLRKKERASYNADLDRITNAITAYRTELAAKYDIKLENAKSLLAANKFDEATKAYEALHTMDPKRPEGRAGLARINGARKNFLGSLDLKVRNAVAEGNIDEARDVLGQIKAMDPSHATIASLERKITDKIADLKKAAEPKPVEIVRNDPAPKKDPPVVKKDPPKTTTTPLIDQNKARERTAMRTALLETLKPYRRGDAATALKRLEAIKGGEDWGSYHWLHGLYLLAQYKYSPQPDEAQREKAAASMTRVAAMMPKFSPDPSLYPDYVISFFNEVKQ